MVSFSPSSGLWPQWALPAVQLIVDNHVGDVAGVLALLISIVGFIATLWNVWRSRSAADRAAAAAEQTRRLIGRFQIVADLSAAVAIMEELRRLHRAGNLDILPDRYAALRKILINVRGTTSSLSDRHQAALQTALTTLRSIESQIERCRTKGLSPDFVKINQLISRDVDDLHPILIELQREGESDI
jgi:hypothetical protein